MLLCMPVLACGCNVPLNTMAAANNIANAAQRSFSQATIDSAKANAMNTYNSEINDMKSNPDYMTQRANELKNILDNANGNGAGSGKSDEERERPKIKIRRPKHKRGSYLYEPEIPR
jgi:hypothetical protein